MNLATFTVLFSVSKNKNFLLYGIVISMLLWGMSWPSAKVLSYYGPPLEIVFIRFIFTFLSVLIILFFLKVKLKINQNGYPLLLLASVLIAIYSMLFFNGIVKGMPGAGGVLVTTMTPIVSYVIALLINKRFPTSKEFIGLSIGLLAACFLLSVWNQSKAIFQSGNLFFLLSTVLWALLSRVTAGSNAYGSPLAFSLWIYLVTIFIFAFFIDLNIMHNIIFNSDKKFWLNMLFNGCLNTGVATTFYFYATSKLGPEKTTSFIYIVPFAASLSSFISIGEVIKWNTIIGGILGILAVWVLNKKTNKKLV